MKYFDYDIHETLSNADHLDSNGLFVGNHHLNLEKEISHLHDVLS